MLPNLKNMTPTEETLSEIHKNTDAVLKEFLEFDGDSFFLKPSAQEWSAAEVGEHLVLVGKHVLKALIGSALPTNRGFDEKLALLRPAMANQDQKFEAPAIAIPQSIHQNRHDIVDELKSVRQEITKLVPGMDLSLTCMDAKHPRVGNLTRYEWIYFDIYHAERHLHQLRTVAQKLKEQSV